MRVPFISQSVVEGRLSWGRAVEALELGHKNARSAPKDLFVLQETKTFMSRAAWVDGIGFGVKNFTVYPDNTLVGLPSVQGIFSFFDQLSGSPKAQIDFELLTYWKTAADSLLGAKKLARKDSKTLLIIGAGVVAKSLVEGYAEIFPELETIQIYARNADRAHRFVNSVRTKSELNVVATLNLEEVCRDADIVATATSSDRPVLFGDYVAEGTHVDLIGAFKADMREADDALMRKARIFVDSFDTTIEHIGEISMPIKSGVIKRVDVLGDHYDLCQGKVGRQSDTEITVFKNGGGAHLDVMMAALIYQIANEDFA